MKTNGRTRAHTGIFYSDNIRNTVTYNVTGNVLTFQEMTEIPGEPNDGGARTPREMTFHMTSDDITVVFVTVCVQPTFFVFVQLASTVGNQVFSFDNYGKRTN